MDVDVDVAEDRGQLRAIGPYGYSPASPSPKSLERSNVGWDGEPVPPVPALADVRLSQSPTATDLPS